MPSGSASVRARSQTPSRTQAARSISDRYRRIYAVVRKIPRGRVATYGQVADLAGFPRHARQVGYALHALREEDRVPWQRVVNARGEISLGHRNGAASLQRALLESEGVDFKLDGGIPLARFQWRPRTRPKLAGC